MFAANKLKNDLEKAFSQLQNKKAKTEYSNSLTETFKPQLITKKITKYPETENLKKIVEDLVGLASEKTTNIPQSAKLKAATNNAISSWNNYIATQPIDGTEYYILPITTETKKHDNITRVVTEE